MPDCCTDPACDAADGQRCVHEQCGECGNSVASIGEQIAQAYQDGRADGLKAPRRRTPRQSWKHIALALGNAMQNHGYCDCHPVESPEPGCPFCADRAVYARFKAFTERHGHRFPDPLEGAESVSIYDLRRST